VAERRGAKSELVLGWEMTSTQEPKYWQDANARPGEQPDDALVTVSPSSMAAHTAIIAQSGSGKSFFMGRLIEEIVAKTKARCVILDPNADFRRLREVQDEAMWTNARFNRAKPQPLPHESSKQDFVEKWPADRITVLTGGEKAADGAQPFKLSWTSLSMDFLAEEIDPMLRSDLHHCHAFVQDVALLLAFKMAREPSTKSRNPDLISRAEQLFRQARSSPEDLRPSLDDEFSVENLAKPSRTGTLRLLGTARASAEWLELLQPSWLELLQPRRTQELVESRVRSAIERVLRAPAYVSPVVEHFYFSKAKEYKAAGIIGDSHSGDKDRVIVIDLPSLKAKSIQLLAVHSVLAREWEGARVRWNEALTKPPKEDTRVPTFIIIDEAHNLIPQEPRGKAETSLREQFRTIVAEGRKYGLFLILVSQRPDKLDPMVVSECENRGLMRLSSDTVLEVARKMLGLEDVQEKLLNKTLEFGVGRALIAGRWAGTTPRLLYSAARRTVEGGRNLRDEYWATASEPPLASQAPAKPETQAASAPQAPQEPETVRPEARSETVRPGAPKVAPTN
jgi:hypothetical protein